MLPKINSRQINSKLRHLFRLASHHRLYFLLGFLVITLTAASTLLVINLAHTPKELAFRRNLVGPWAYSAHIEYSGMQTNLGVSKDGAKVEVNRGKSSLTFTLPVKNAEISGTDKNITYTLAKEPLRINYELTKEGLKEQIIAEKPGLPKTLPIGLTLKNLFIAVSPEGVPNFYSKDGEYQFSFEKPYAVDAKGVVSHGFSYQLIPVSQFNLNSPVETALTFHNAKPGEQILRPLTGSKTILPQDTSYKLVLVLDDAWLKDPSRAYPVTIDPTVTHYTVGDFTGGQFNRSANTSPSSLVTQATGGTVSYYGNYVVHTFTSGGSFVPSVPLSIDYFVVGGGGGGGANGGGGGGGILSGSDSLSAGTYSISIGSAGALHTSGGNSVFNSHTAIGGGRGGDGGESGANGGSGGGGGGCNSTPGGTGSQGGNGGAGDPTYCVGGGGGGAAPANGGVGWDGNCGPGGAGYLSNITGTSIYYAGGGGGDYNRGSYRLCSGAAGSTSASYGGGGDAQAAGGPGVVIIRYPASYSQAGDPNITTNYQELATDRYTVGLWHMNESSGTTTVSDSSGNSNTGTSSSSTNVGLGVIGNDRSFSGTSFFTTGSLTGFSTGNVKHTVEAWVKPNATPTTRQWPLLLGGATTGNLHWLYQSDGIMYIGIWGVTTCQVTPTVGAWQHVAETYDGNTLSCYLNGKLVSTAISNQYNFTATTLAVAQAQISEANFNGDLDELRISTVARTADEIRLDAQRRPYSVFTSSVVDFGLKTTSWNGLSWNELGVGTGDGETIPSVASDTFTRANSTTSLGTAESGQAYTISAGTFGISSNMAYLPSGCAPTQCYAVLETGSTDGSMQVTMPTNHQDVRLPFRYVDADHSYWVENVGASYTLIKRNGAGGGNVQLAAGGTAANGDTIRVDYFGSSLKVYNNNALIMSATDSDLSGTKAGFGTWSNTSITFDNFSVSTLRNGLVAQWNLNETSGTTATNSSAGSCGSACNLTLTSFSNTTGQDVVAGSGWTAANGRWPASAPAALMFNGSSNYATVADPGTSPFDLTGDLSIETWVNPAATQLAYAEILSKHATGNAGFVLEMNGTANSNSYYFAWGNGTGYECAAGTVISLVPDQWQHIAVSKTGTAVSIYLNGQLQKTCTGTNATVATNNDALMMGRFSSGGARFFNGMIDSTSIYSRALSASEILASYNSGNLELQTRVGSTSDPNDGVNWDAWAPVSSESQLLSADSDSANWSLDTAGTITASDDANTKVEGSGSLKLQSGYLNPTATNLASGKSYTESPTPHASYPDTGGTELTDGQLTTGWSDGKSFGYYNNTNSYVVVDLGSSQTVSEIAVYFGSGTASQVYYPTNAGVSTSTDNVAFTYRGSLSCNADTSAESASWCLSQFAPISARYLKVAVTQTAATQWTMWSEFRAGNGDLFTAGLWHLDETGGSGAYYKDATSNHFDGTPSGVQVINGIIGKGIHNGNIAISDNAALRPANFTVEGWIKTTDSSSWLAWKYTNSAPWSGWGLGNGLSVAGKAGCWVGGTAWTNGFSLINDNKWHHIACTYNGTLVKVYVDGALEGTQAQTANFTTTPDLNLGVNPTDDSVDEVRVSNIARTPVEISTAYQLGLGSRLDRTLGSTDLTSAQKLAFNVAADRPGTYLQAAIGNSAYSNYETDANTVGLWHLDSNNKSITGDTFLNSASLTSHYSLDEVAGGSALDTSGYGYTLTNNATGVTWAKYNFGRSFNGSSAYLTRAANNTAATTNWALEAWIMPGSLSQLGMAVYNGNDAGGYGFGIANGGSGAGNVLTVLFGGVAWFNCGYSFGSTTTWYHVVVTRDATTTRCYVNGVVTSGSWTNNPNAVGARFSIGNEFSGSSPTRYFNGQIDEVRTYARNLTAAEIANTYARYLNGGTLPFADASGNMNLGTDNGSISSVGKIGTGRYFGGDSTFISVTDSASLQLATPLTVETWFKTTTTPVTTTTCMVRKDTASGATRYLYGLNMNTNSKAQFQYYNGTNFTIDSLNVVTDGRWHQAVGVISGTTGSFYLDGQLQGTSTITGTQGTPNGEMSFGSCPPWVGGGVRAGYYTGQLDEVRVSNSARTAALIRDAYEYGLRTHEITIDFGAKLDSGNLIADSNDKSFTVDATVYGAGQKGSNLSLGDKLIVRENYNGTIYIAQGTVNALTASTGAVTVAAWDTGSTFPTSGFTVNADVFKWQQESMDLSGIINSEKNGITKFTLLSTSGTEGHSVWLDDLRSVGSYLSNPLGSSITSATGKRYFQYRVIESSSDYNVSPAFSSVTVDYVLNSPPNTPTLDLPTNGAAGQSLTPALKTTATDANSDNLQYKIDFCQDTAMTQNCISFDQSSDQTGWSGQNADGGTTYTSGTQATYTLQTSLLIGTSYYWRSYALDPGGANIWSSTQATPYSFTTSRPPTTPSALLTNGLTNPTGIITLTPYFSALHHDPDGDSANYYQIEVNTASDFSGTSLWDSTKTSMTTTADGARSPNITYAGTSLTLNGATYYWHIRFWDSFGNTGAWSATSQFSMNHVPGVPTLDFPASGAINVELLTALKTTGLDADSDYLRYKIQICTDLAMTQNCQTIDQTSSQTGWSGQNANSSTAYTSGTQAIYTIQTSLTPSTRYYWRSYTLDPAGTNSWSSTQTTPSSFTTTSYLPAPSGCRIQETDNDTSLTLLWVDNALNETGYEVQRSVDGAAYSILHTGLAAGTTTDTDSTVSDGHTYQYRVAAYSSTGPSYSQWCTTPATSPLNLQLGTFIIN